jgi:hypothetical protein
MTWRQSQIQLQDRVAHALIDTRFAGTIPVRELPCLNWFGIWFSKPAPVDAYIAPEEEQNLTSLERHLIEIAGDVASGWAVYCLRLMSRGMAEYYLYSRDGSTLAEVAPRLRQHAPGYRIEHETKEDPDWSEYSKYLKAVG